MQAARPSPRRIPGLFAFLYRRDPLAFLQRLKREQGDIARLDLGGQPIVLLSDPEHVRDVLITNHKRFHKGRGLERAKTMLGDGLLTSEDDLHLRQRRLMQPAFHRARIAGYADAMVAFGERTSRRWAANAVVDIHQEMMHLTMAIVAQTLFGSDVEGEAHEIGESMTTAFRMFDFAMYPFSEYLEKLPLPGVRRFRSARARLDATIYRMIAERRASSEDRGDLLSMLLLARDTEGDGGRMTDTQLRDEAMTLFLAGHETTANALTWTWYLLSQHPDVEMELHREIDDVLGPRLPTSEDASRLPYTRMVLAESMRLYPPAWVIGRRAMEDYEVGGVPIPERAIILMSQYIIHRDARWWPEPDRFDPRRFASEAPGRPKLAYFPFGAGPRQCIGEPFAWMEGVLLLATLARRWRLRLLPGHPVALHPLITLRPKHGMRMITEPRAGGDR